MKHLNVLEDAGLVLVRRSGRERWNYLNPVPIREIYERWIGKYAEHWSSALLRLREHVEHDMLGVPEKPTEPEIDTAEPAIRRRRGA
jgi:DNA-binding transcriptional ArsR family regulator